MITGYNTDVKHNDMVFHVQTEDKGTGNPYIETLIYVGGQVLAAKRTSYADLVEGGADVGPDKKAVGKIMDDQHKSMIIAIRDNEYQGKVRELFGTDAYPAVEDDSPLLDRVPENDRTLDEVILEYLTTESQQEHLLLAVEEELELAFGTQTAVTVRASSSKSGLPVSGASVSVKLISTSDRPRVLAAGSTDPDGCLELEMEIPEVVDGTSALIVTADSPIGKAELKYLL